MAASNRSKVPVKRAAVNGHANGNRSYAVIELSSADVVSDERIPLFSIDGTDYTMPAEVPGSVSMEATELWATEGEASATRWLMLELLGEDGWAALRGCKTITKAQTKQVIQIIVEHAMGGDEDPKGS